MAPLTNSAGLVANGDIHLYAEVSVGPSVDGDPVLLLSEAEAPSTRWPTSLVEGFTDRGYPVITLDTRDVGRSSWVTEPYAIADLVSDAVAVLDHHGVGSVHVVGRSMGGIVAQHLALDRPERVSTLSLVSTTPGRRDVFGPPEEWLIDAMSERLYGDVPDGVVARVEWVIEQLEWFAGPLVEFDRKQAARRVYAEVAEMWRGQNNHGLAVVEAPDRYAELASLRVPTMVVHGTADPVYPVLHGQGLAEQIEGARMHLIEGLGHDLPEPFVPQLLELFIELDRSR